METLLIHKDHLKAPLMEDLIDLLKSNGVRLKYMTPHVQVC